MIPYGHQSITDDDIQAVVDAIHSDWLTTGPKVPEFEQELSRYISCKEAVAVNSGTSALDIAVQSLALEKGSEVLTTPLTFAATSNALLYNGLKPVYADIVKGTRNIDPEKICNKISSKTRAVLVVDFAGQPCELNTIKKICCENDLVLIEDACHALGASYHQKKIGTIADMTIFSFHPVKAITTGEGGMIVSDNPDYAAKMRILRTHGIDKSLSPHPGPSVGWEYDMVELGRNYRMTDIQAALGISQLRKLDKFIKRRNELSKIYSDLLSDCTFVELPQSIEDICHAWHIFTVLVNGIERNAFFAYMRKHDVGVNLHYIPTYRLQYYRNNLPQNPADYPVTEDVFNRIITLPLYTDLTENNIHHIVEIMKDAYRSVV